MFGAIQIFYRTVIHGGWLFHDPGAVRLDCRRDAPMQYENESGVLCSIPGPETRLYGFDKPLPNVNVEAGEHLDLKIVYPTDSNGVKKTLWLFGARLDENGSISHFPIGGCSQENWAQTVEIDRAKKRRRGHCDKCGLLSLDNVPLRPALSKLTKKAARDWLSFNHALNESDAMSKYNYVQSCQRFTDDYMDCFEYWETPAGELAYICSTSNGLLNSTEGWVCLGDEDAIYDTERDLENVKFEMSCTLYSRRVYEMDGKFYTYVCVAKEINEDSEHVLVQDESGQLLLIGKHYFNEFAKILTPDMLK